jgi:hypothetical protein
MEPDHRQMVYPENCKHTTTPRAKLFIPPTGALFCTCGQSRFFFLFNAPGRRILPAVKRFIQSILLTCMLSVLPSLLPAQARVHLSVGLNGSYAGLDSLNFIIDQFNLDNPDYAKPLANIHVPMGIYVNAGANFSPISAGPQLHHAYPGRPARAACNEPEWERTAGAPPLQCAIPLKWAWATIS